LEYLIEGHLNIDARDDWKFFGWRYDLPELHTFKSVSAELSEQQIFQ